jgi:hypothetical protein
MQTASKAFICLQNGSLGGGGVDIWRADDTKEVR